MGWRGAARGHKSDLLPVSRSEYLALDVVAFETAGDRRWRFPVGVFELENSPADDLVAYSLWKVCACARVCAWCFVTAGTRVRGRSWCVTSLTRSSRRWRSRRVRPRWRNARDRRLAQRNRYVPLRLLQRLDARRQYGALPSQLIGDRAWHSNPGTSHHPPGGPPRGGRSTLGVRRPSRPRPGQTGARGLPEAGAVLRAHVPDPNLHDLGGGVSGGSRASRSRPRPSSTWPPSSAAARRTR